MKRTRIRSGRVLTLVGIMGCSFALVLGSTGAAPKDAEKKAAKDREQVTYSNQVARMMQDKCQNCHHAGTSAPFALASYDDAVTAGRHHPRGHH